MIKKIRLYFIYFIGLFLRGSISKDKKYLSILYKYSTGKKIDFSNPKTFNEKIQWLKLYDRKDIYTQMVDKYEAKIIAGNVIGIKHVIPTLGVWNNFDEINFDELPNQFVLKCTHDSGGVIICNDKSKFNLKSARRKITHCLKRNYFYNHREWPYKNVKPKIIAEKFMIDESGTELKDYKFFCYNGKVKYLFIATDRNVNDTKFDFYDRNFKHLPFTNGHPNSNRDIKKPNNFDLMIEMAEKLSTNIPHVRIDLYNINGKIFFGEYTFYHWSGMVPFVPNEWDYKFGEDIDLNLVKGEKNEENTFD